MTSQACEPPGISCDSNVVVEFSSASSLVLLSESESLTNQSTQNYAAPSASHSDSKEKLCVVCGDRASGYHYNALSCEGCKGFFRRSVTRKARYQCKYGDNCMMDMWMRRKCRACRLQRCRDVGMKEVCLMNESQCLNRNTRRQSKPTDEMQITSSNRSCQRRRVALAGDVLSPLERLSVDNRKLISLVVTFQEQFELPSTEDIARLTDLEISQTLIASDERMFARMIEMTILVTRLIVEFAKRLPGFKNLVKEDQVVLLKGSASEVMMLRTARRFDPQSNSVVFGDGTPFNRDALAGGGLQDYVDCMFNFASKMSQISVDNTEYALLTAICIFSDRPGLVNRASVEAVQEIYVNTLCAYVVERRRNCSVFLARLLMKLVELRSLSIEHALILYRLTIERGSLPPLLQEYFDLPAQT